MLRIMLLVLLCQPLIAQEVDTLKMQPIHWDDKFENLELPRLYPDKSISNRNAVYFKLYRNYLYQVFLSVGNYNFRKTHYDIVVDTLVLKLQYTVDKQLSLCADQDGDGSFSDEAVHLTPLNKEVKLPLMLRWRGKDSGRIYTAIRNYKVTAAWDAKREEYFLKDLKAGSGYRITEGLPEKMRAHIGDTGYEGPIHLYDSLGNKIQSKKPNYNKTIRLFEPFKVSGKWYYLGPINEPKQEIYLYRLSEKEKPYGFAVGHYVNLELLDKNTNLSLFQQWDTLQQPYALIHFWGPWCVHCRKEKQEVAALAKQLKQSPIHWIEVAVLFPTEQRPATMQEAEAKEQVADIEEFRDQNISNLLDNNLYAGGFNPYIYAKSLSKQFENTTHPSYYLISKTGEIILVHAGRMEDKLLPKLEPYLGE